jgi:hypothetical protein
MIPYFTGMKALKRQAIAACEQISIRFGCNVPPPVQLLEIHQAEHQSWHTSVCGPDTIALAY